MAVRRNGKKSNMVTCQRLKEVLWYTPNTGLFIWNQSKGRYKSGDRAGTVRPDGRLQIFIDGRPYLAHRLAWLYVHGSWPASDVDHINRNPLDNRMKNLRTVTRSENIQNSGPRKTNKSGILGVHFIKKLKKWTAQISINGNKKYLGVFNTAEEAAHARKLAEQTFQPGKVSGDKRIIEEANGKRT